MIACVTRVLLSLFFLLLATGYVYTQREVYVHQLSGAPIEVGKEFTVLDTKYGELRDDSAMDEADEVTNRLIWTLYPEEGKLIGPGIYKLLVEIFTWDDDTDSDARANDGIIRELTINVSEKDFSQPRALLTFNGAKKFRVLVRNSTHDTRPVKDGLDMQLVGEVIVKRSNCVLNFDTQPADNVKFMTENAAGDLESIVDPMSGTVNVQVAHVYTDECALGYDLEYAFFDESSTVGRTVLGGEGSSYEASVDQLMRHNATRMTIREAPYQFRLFNLFRNGVVLFRYRALGLDAIGNPVHTPWSSRTKTLGELVSKIRVNHQSDRNWQANTSFAEDAKQLPTISYQDGTMRSRQNMTIQYGEINGAPSPSTEFMISQRSLYDAVGRTAATLLPSPIYKSEITDSSLAFKTDHLERAPDDVALYNKTELEKAGHGQSINGVSTKSGAGNYYSIDNNKDNDKLRERNAFVPDAQAFPLSVTRFTADNTGRIRRQGNVGEAYQPGRNDTRYFYGKPDQVELDRLFGTNVGNASHYEKRATIDPNQQASVAYIDAKGRTIATALAGLKPSSLENLASYEEAVSTTSPRRVDILNNSGGDTIITTHTLIVTSPTNYSVCYVLDEADYCLNCPLDSGDIQNECYECTYDVQVRIAQTDAIGVPAVFEFFENGVGSSGSTNDCFSGSLTINERLNVGEYIITKKVWVSEASVAVALAEFEDSSACINDSTTFAETYLEAIDLEGCLVCDCELPRRELSSACRTYCIESVTPCIALRQVMLNDVSPGGQYAAYTLDSIGEIEITDAQTPSIFAAVGNFLYYQTVKYGISEITIDNHHVKPDELTPQQFINNFRKEWAVDLLPRHPEACLLEWCDDRIDTRRGPDNISSFEYDTELRKVTTWADAKQYYPIPDLYLPTGHSIDSFYHWKMLAMYQSDPMSVGTEFVDDMRSRFAQQASGDRTDPLFVMEQYALATWGDGTSGSWEFIGAAPYQQDIAWRTFRDIYLGQKRYVSEELQKESCAAVGTMWECLTQPICSELDCENMEGCSDTPLAESIARVTFVSNTDIFNAVDSADIHAFAENADNIRQDIVDACEIRCAEYAMAWRTDIYSCASTVDTNNINTAIRIMVDICQTGCAAGLPEGSSTVPDGIYYADTLRTFPQVLSALVFKDESCVASGGCNSYMINYPPPASQDVYYGTLTLSGPSLVMWLTANYKYLDYQIERLRDGCACITCPSPESTTQISPSIYEGVAYFNGMTVANVDTSLGLIQQFLSANPTGQVPFNIPDDVLAAGEISIPAELNSVGRFCLNRERIEEYLSEAGCGGGSFITNPEFYTEYLNGVLGWGRTQEEYNSFLSPNGAYLNNCLLCADPINPIPSSGGEVSCEELLRVEAINEANYHYDRYYAVERNIFAKQYRENCLENVTEQLQIEYTPLEYHYTLYYYDQAGNLSMTIPPEGVKPITSQSKIDTVATWRGKLNNSRYNSEPYGGATKEGVLPEHTMLTSYAHNSFNEITIKDNPDSDPIYMWYDQFGRVVASQDGRQNNDEINEQLYSYTKYDDLGRVNEVGEVAFESSQNRAWFDNQMTTFIQNEIDDESTNSIDVTQNASYTQFETFTAYTERPTFYSDIAINAITSRNRVASVYTRQSSGNSKGNYATHYVYDIAGNVKTLIQDFPELEDIGHRLKRMDYDYDLISGNVHALFYQKGETDQFTYRYEYDKLNRLSAAYSSEIDIDDPSTATWKRDAVYTYFDYGPLHRTIIGQNNLQGIDMAYTAQGWIKVVNGSRSEKWENPKRRQDMGADGFVFGEDERLYGALNPVNNRDLYRYSLYYNGNDYLPTGFEDLINTNSNDYIYNWGTQNFYNGNIAAIARNTVEDGYGLSTHNAKFDQLYRLTWMDSSTRYRKDKSNNNPTGKKNILEYRYQYDGNGNMLELSRDQTSWYTFDGLEKRSINLLGYTYANKSNRLNAVNVLQNDGTLSVRESPFQRITGDLKFKYDGTGNIVQRFDENTNNQAESRISWTPYGKVAYVDNISQLLGASTRSDFGYGPDQTRWVKTRTRTDKYGGPIVSFNEYQVRDASGNTLATYYGGQLFDRLGDGTYQNREERSPFTWKQQYLYGSSRLGQVEMERPVVRDCKTCDASKFLQRNFGTRFYELSDHLGNVTSVFGENIEQKQESKTIQGTTVTTTYRIPQLKSYTDYTPFGLSLARTEDGVGKRAKYRYGFNGKEKDDDGEWGNSTVYDYGFRVYDPGIARFLSVDPLAPSYPFYSPYHFAGNSPISHIDLDGLEPRKVVRLAFDQEDRPVLEVKNWTFIKFDRGNVVSVSFSYGLVYEVNTLHGTMEVTAPHTKSVVWVNHGNNDTWYQGNANGTFKPSKTLSSHLQDINAMQSSMNSISETAAAAVDAATLLDGINLNQFDNVLRLGSDIAKNIKWKGFSKGQLKTHFTKHGDEFGEITQKEYLQRAKDFAAEVGENIQEAVVGNFVIKHDKGTGRTLVGHMKKKEIRTYYKDDGRDADAFQSAIDLATELGKQ